MTEEELAEVDGFYTPETLEAIRETLHDENLWESERIATDIPALIASVRMLWAALAEIPKLSSPKTATYAELASEIVGENKLHISEVVAQIIRQRLGARSRTIKGCLWAYARKESAIIDIQNGFVSRKQGLGVHH